MNSEINSGMNFGMKVSPEVKPHFPKVIFFHFSIYFYPDNTFIRYKTALVNRGNIYGNYASHFVQKKYSKIY